MKIVSAEVLKIADVQIAKISQDTKDYLDKNCVEFQDKHLSENIYSIYEPLDNIKYVRSKRPSELIILDLEALKDVLDKLECSYVRLVG